MCSGGVAATGRHELRGPVRHVPEPHLCALCAKSLSTRVNDSRIAHDIRLAPVLPHSLQQLLSSLIVAGLRQEVQQGTESGAAHLDAIRKHALGHALGLLDVACLRVAMKQRAVKLSGGHPQCLSTGHPTFGLTSVPRLRPGAHQRCEERDQLGRAAAHQALQQDLDGPRVTGRHAALEDEVPASRVCRRPCGQCLQEECLGFVREVLSGERGQDIEKPLRAQPQP
mmetsp:Transcript_71361/g.197055  ORF Transcript_71361/g.197055 Transcript_71361/m.197055 type:complete len:226 (-) Transcript_71361:65-742(-)